MTTPQDATEALARALHDAEAAISEGDYWFQFEHSDVGTIANAQAAYTKALAIATIVAARAALGDPS